MPTSLAGGEYLLRFGASVARPTVAPAVPDSAFREALVDGRHSGPVARRRRETRRDVRTESRLNGTGIQILVKR
ncbi:hypothetical protein [Halorubrum halophilum]|uniref:hypothetical protein n=1 Tax=Halorubrum halophilum TaxID=413816 RepID=UPI00186AF98F|nr:hypothetical protein [Halorubrum halophilum]